ncbi:MAG: ATP-binding protein [Phocaeicola sp.]
MNQYKGKKLLILGGANQHLKLVEAAKELGVYTIVTDYLSDSPCKRICDETLMLNITDVSGIVKYCKKNSVDGVITGFLDPCQIPYSQICTELNLPCFGTPEQFFKFTNKIAFKELCHKNGLNVIQDYTEADIKADTIEYPVFIKPVDSRGSRGQTVCYSAKEMSEAIKFAKEQSSNGDILIERYMGDCDEVQITNFLINGEIYLLRTVDSNRGSADLNLGKVVNCSISPSKYTEIYLKNTHSAVCKMIRDLGIKNGPIFMQGFYKDEKIYFFDPGLRFPGVEFERIYKKVWGVDIAQLLIQFALTGRFPEGTTLPRDGATLNGKVAAILFPVLRGGKIKTITGFNEYLKDPHTISCLTRYKEGDEVNWTYDVNQRYAEVDILGNNINDLSEAIKKFYTTVKIQDEWNKDMFFDKFNTNRLKNWYDNITKNKEKLTITIITEDDLLKAGCFNVQEAITVTEMAFRKRAEGSVIFPDKVSVIFDEKSQNRINCLPAGLKKDNVYGMKWVSVFPGNPHLYGLQNLSAVILLSELQHGFPKAFMEGTLCSNLRTAATSAVAAKYLARKNSKVIGFIGAGEQAKTHFMTMSSIFPNITTCKVSSRTTKSEKKFIQQMSRLYPHIEFIACNNSYEKAAINSDIIITAISGQEKILQAEWISPGAFYCHVGGLEDDFSVPKKANKIVCDDWNVVKHRTQTISRMYKQGLLKDENIYCNLTDLVSGAKVGRTSDEEFIYFNTVGMSYVDVMLANHMYKKVLAEGLGLNVTLQNKSMFDVDESYITK